MNTHKLDSKATRIRLSDLDPKSILYRIASVSLRYANEYKAMRDGEPVIVTK